jgi:hypothetical protein
MSSTLHNALASALREAGFTSIEAHRSARTWTMSARNGDETVVIQISDTGRTVARHGTVDHPMSTLTWTMPAMPD